VERIKTEIDIKLKGSRDLLKFNEGVKKLTTSIEQSVKSINQFQKKNELVLKSVNNLNASLSATKTNFNNVALGTDQARVAASQYLRSLRDTNAALAEQKAAVISLQNARRSEASFLASGARAGRSNANAEAESQARSVAIARARNLELQAAMANQELARQVATRAPRLPAFEERGLRRLENFKSVQDELEAKKELKKLETEANKLSKRRLNVQEQTNKKVKQEISLGRTNKKNQKLINASYEDRIKFAERNGEIRRQALIRANNLVLAEQKINQQQAARGGRTLGQGLKGGLSNALIGGGFPLLFGQGPAAAIGGGLGGLAGGMIGGGFGFALSIVGTAIGQAVSESNKFNKSLTTLNNQLIAVGGSSQITARDIGELKKSIGGTKDEALQLLNQLKRFGPEGSKRVGTALGKDASSLISTIASVGKDDLSTNQALAKLVNTLGNEKVLQLKNDLKGLSVDEKRLKIAEELQKVQGFKNLSERERKALRGELRGGRSTTSLLRRARKQFRNVERQDISGDISQEADVLGLTNKPGKTALDTSKQDLAVLQTRIALIKQGGTLLDEERQKLEQQLILDTRALEIAQANENQDKIRLANKKAFTSLATLDAQVAAAQTEEDKRRNEIITNTMEKLEGESQFLEESLSLGVEKAEIEKQIRDIVAIVGDEREGEVRSLVEGNAAQREKLQLLAEEKAMQQQIQGILAGGMTNAVMGLIDGTRTLGQALADIAKQLASMFLNRAFSSLFSNMFSGGGGGGSVGALPPSPIYVAAQGGFSRAGGFKAFQSGGVVNSPTLGMVGEGGESEYVIPASKMSGAMARYSAGARGGAVIPGGSGDSGTVAGGTGNTVVEYTGPTLNFNGDEYVPKSAVPDIIGAATKQGAMAGKAQTFNALKNSRSQRASLGL
jgi:hypothetical protein